ncbi:MAG: chemotaxis protein CheC [Eubacteriales bacterium]
MAIRNYDELNKLELDTLREIGSIGTGNAATALSTLLGKEVRISMPEVRIMEYNEAIDWIGGPEVITAGVMVRLGGEMSGIMMNVQQMEFVNILLESMLDIKKESYDQLDEIDFSALTEAGNIMISTFINALSSLSGVTLSVTVPSFCVDMQGAILAVPMAEYGGATDYIMTIGSEFICDNKVVPCHLLLSPDIRSLNFLLRKLGVADE